MQIYLVRNQKFKPLLYFKPKNEKSKFIWSETRNSNLSYILSVKREKQIYLVRNQKFKRLLYFKPKNKESKFIWSEIRNSNLFYILSLKTRKANLFDQKLEI